MKVNDMERKIGEKFTLRGKTYITVEGEECNGCAFKDSRICLLIPSRRIIGYCCQHEREDSTSVIFKEVHGSDFDIDDKPIKLNNMKPFNLEEAKAGKPVCTRTGDKVRILCFDRNDSVYPIVAAISYSTGEDIELYTNNGETSMGSVHSTDLMMATEKKKGWVNIYLEDIAVNYSYSGIIYDTKEMADREYKADNYVCTIPVEWEEKQYYQISYL